MTADRDAGLVDVAVRLRVRRFDHLVDVDAGLLGEHGELVGQSDVDVSVGGLGELGHLGGLGRTEVPDAVASFEVGTLVEVEHLLVEGASLPSAPVVAQAADELGILAQVLEDPAGQHAFGGEDQVEVGRPRPARCPLPASASTGCASCRRAAWSRR